MANIFDYLLWRGDLSFSAAPFNPVDNIIFSQLAYLPFDGIVPSPESRNGIRVEEAAYLFAKRHTERTLQGPLIFKDDAACLAALGQAQRYKNCVLHSYVNHLDAAQEKQFAALCVELDKCCFIAYRGTDASLVGWKEDLSMSFKESIPAQLEAASFLKTIAKKTGGALWLGGHSKGGNLAVYAAATAAKTLREKIKRIYCNDAPGFHSELIASDGFTEIKERVISFVPQSSIIGMLFEHGFNSAVVRSTQIGIMQHELYSWEVTHNDMVRLDHLTPESEFADRTLREWINNLDYNQRQQFTEALFTVLSAAKVASFAELGNDWFKSTGLIIQSIGNIDHSTRRLIRKTIALLFKSMRNNIETLLPEKKEK